MIGLQTWYQTINLQIYLLNVVNPVSVENRNTSQTHDEDWSDDTFIWNWKEVGISIFKWMEVLKEGSVAFC